MDDSSEGVVAALAIFGIFIMPVIGWIAVRWLAHRERMEMIRHGIVPPLKGRSRDWQRAAADATQAVPPGGSPGEPDFTVAGERIALRKGIRLTFIGLALTIGLSFIGYSDGGPFGMSLHPGPWLLGGLIPMFIGLAQVVSSMLAGATIITVRRSGFTPPPPPFIDPPFSPPPPPGMPTYDSSYTYRPGDTAELRPPPRPPDRL
jgi:hypothetical protein